MQEQLLMLMVKSGESSKAELLHVTDQFASATTSMRVTILVTAIAAFLLAMTTSYVISKLSVIWLRRLTAQTKRVATGDLTIDIERDNDSQIGDIQEALGKLLASFRATINRIELAADELRDAAGEMAHTSDEAGHAIGEVAQSISAISEGAAHQVTRHRHVTRRRRHRDFRSMRPSIRWARAPERRDRGSDRRRRQARHRDSRGDAERARDVARNGRDGQVARREVHEHRPDRPVDHRHRRTDQPVGAQRRDRSGARRRAGPRIRGRRGRSTQARRRRTGVGGEIAADRRDSSSDRGRSHRDGRGVETVEDGFEAVNRNRQAFFDISGAVRRS